MTIHEMIDKYYEEFKGLPSNAPIVRNNQKNDAFELVVLNILYSKQLRFSVDKNHLEELSRIVIAPPDGGIDLFIERSSGDDYTFDIIQVKHAALTQSELKTAILQMKRTIDDYCQDPHLVDSPSCLKVLKNSNLDKNTKEKSCHYFVVHTGDVADFTGLKEDEHIITLRQLEILHNNKSDNVDYEVLNIEDNSNILNYQADKNIQALICSVKGTILAELNNKYSNTELGRNILFGQNLREELNLKKSKTYKSMVETINNCPQNFWFYNNGITIITNELEYTASKNKIELKNFSIVNGAQTTSSLGLYLKDNSNSIENKKKLDKVHVLTRILKVSDEDMQRNIAIYNNTQNPITSRDMVANRDEQLRLHDWLVNKDEYPQIFVEIRRGAKIPSTFNKIYVHRYITNEELAQIAYATFLLSPFTAKDKKSSLFNVDFNQTEYIINEIYHKIFYYDEEKSKCGILFKKSKTEIDEALFIGYLYRLCSQYLRKAYKERVEGQQAEREKALQSGDEMIVQQCEERIKDYSSILGCVSVCMFYFDALYYEFKAQFPSETLKKRFDFEKFYEDKHFKESLIKAASNLFLTLTIKILNDTAKDAGKNGNINNWVRNSSCQGKFFEVLRKELSMNMDLEEKYKDFVQNYMIVYK